MVYDRSLIAAEWEERQETADTTCHSRLTNVSNTLNADSKAQLTVYASIKSL